MPDQERIEQARAEREARDSVVHRPPRGTSADAVEAALARYLAAEQYHEQDPTAPRAGKADQTPSDEGDGEVDDD